jgi:hypothetical protein
MAVAIRTLCIPRQEGQPVMDGAVSNGSTYADSTVAPPEQRLLSSHLGAEWAARIAREVSKAMNQ